MNSTNRCPECDSPLAATTGEPMCPACLMRGMLQPSDSEMESSLLADTRSVAESSEWDSMQSIGATATFTDLEPGSRFGDYRIVGRLGRGGMGIVYEAEHLPTSRRVALKVLAQSLDQPDARARFLREGRLAASINHPNSVYVYGTEEIESVPTITMELVDGGTLAQLVKTEGPMAVRDAVDAVLQIIDGLEAADRRGVLHRDVKPSNCFVAIDGTVKVGDFGLSISTTGGPTHSMTDVTVEGTFLGTPAFASPEQLRGEPLDRRSDIYAVGVTLYYLLSGRVPFDAENMVHLLATVLDKPAPAITSVRADVPAELEAIITRCLQKPAGNRFESYDSLRSELRRFGSEAPVPASLGSRALSGMVDSVICWGTLMILNLAANYDMSFGGELGAAQTVKGVLISISLTSLIVAYYTIGEWRFGYTIGKRLFHLRVVSGDGRARLGQALGRALMFIWVPAIPSLVFNFSQLSKDPTNIYQGMTMAWAVISGWSFYVLKYGLFASARSTNGYLAIHDRVTRTRVLHDALEPKHVAASQADQSYIFDDETPMTGPYHHLKTLYERNQDRLVLGFDTKLLRRVWLHIQPVGTKPVAASTRSSSDDRKLRWLGGRRSESESWDCYEAPDGQLFQDSVSSASGVWGIRVMRRLVGCLNRYSETSRDNLSIQQLWVTNSGEIKWLPLAICEVPSDGPVEHETVDTSAGLVRDAANLFLRRDFDLSSDRQDWTIGSWDAIRRLSQVSSLDDATRVLQQTERQQPVQMRARLIGMIVVALSFPAMSAVIGLFALITFYRQQEQYPEIAQLSEAIEVLHREQSRSSPSRIDRLIAVRHYIAANYGDVIEDREKMNSLYAIVTLTPADRISLKKTLDQPPATPEEFADAERLFPIALKEAEIDPVPRATIQQSFWTSIGPAIVWIEFIWIPSLVTGLLFRGGILIRLFRLVMVDRKGRRASRPRVLFRMIVSGVPVVAVAYFSLFWAIGNQYTPAMDPFLLKFLTSAVLALMVCVTCWVIWRRGNQCWSDRISGTYFMAK